MSNQHKVSLAELRALYGEDAALPEQVSSAGACGMCA